MIIKKCFRFHILLYNAVKLITSIDLFFQLCVWGMFPSSEEGREKNTAALSRRLLLFNSNLSCSILVELNVMCAVLFCVFSSLSLSFWRTRSLIFCRSLSLHHTFASRSSIIIAKKEEMPHRMRKIVSQCRSPFLSKHHKRYHHCTKDQVLLLFSFSSRDNLKFNIDYRPNASSTMHLLMMKDYINIDNPAIFV